MAAESDRSRHSPDSLANNSRHGFALRPRGQGAGWFYRLAKALVNWWSNWYFRFEVIHPERFPARGAALVVPTHSSYLDPPLVGAHLPQPAYYMARETLFHVPILGIMLRSLQVYPIRRGASDRAALREGRKILEAGWPLMFFPEGTRTRTGKLGAIQGGFALLLEGLQIPYVPINIQDSGKVMPRGAFFPRPRKVRMIVGEPNFLPARQPQEKLRNYIDRCAAQLEAEYRNLGAQ